jgi:hypothetical protein
MRKLLLPLLAILLFTSCEKQISTDKVPEEIAGAAANKKAEKITICHHDVVTGSYKTININPNAWPEHQAHGDILGECPGEVLSPTGRIWLDRNLGASRVATSSTDYLAYGSLYQWGRGSDGHQLTNWTSSTAGTPFNSYTVTQSSTDAPGHSLFISVFPDWRNPPNDNLWQGVNGINNPCPAGYRLPTISEFNAELATFSPQNSDGAFASVLKLPVAGRRQGGDFLSDGGVAGYYWTSSVNFTTYNASYSVLIYNYNGYFDFTGRVMGNCVRCIKD